MSDYNEDQLTQTTTVETRAIDGPARSDIAEHNYKLTVAKRVVWLIMGSIMGLLTLRFLLRLMGADPASAFANFIYVFSSPFVAPFFGLFSYQANLAQGRVEFETLIAIAVYGLLGMLIVRGIMVTRR